MEDKLRKKRKNIKAELGSLMKESDVAASAITDYQPMPEIIFEDPGGLYDKISKKFKLKIGGRLKYALLFLLFFITPFFILNSKPSFDNEVDGVIYHVSKLLVLPTDETPTLATVTNPDPLKGSPFFKSAMVGDKVLIYARSNKAILFRPRENKIIEIGSLNTGIINKVDET